MQQGLGPHSRWISTRDKEKKRPDIEQRNHAVNRSTTRGHFHAEHTHKLLVPGVDIDLKFTRATEAFYLIRGNASGFKAAISDASMHVRKVKINPGMTMKHILTMQKGIPAKYPLRSDVVTSFTIAAGSLSFSKENLVTKQPPRRVFLGLVSNASFNSHGGDKPLQLSPLRPQLSDAVLLQSTVPLETPHFKLW